MTVPVYFQIRGTAKSKRTEMQIDAIGDAGSSGFFGAGKLVDGATPTAAVLAAVAIFVAVAVALPANALSAEVNGTENANVTPLKTTNLRYDEDYSYLRDPEKRTGAWWERYKYVPLSFSDDAYLTLGLELRFREEAYRNFNWGELSVNEYQWYRTLPYADLHFRSKPAPVRADDRRLGHGQGNSWGYRRNRG